MAQDSSDPTLPSVVASLRGDYQERELILTIVFHPRTSRIGEFAVLALSNASGDNTIGRLAPSFQTANADPANVEGWPLGDPHVSKLALKASYSGPGLQLARYPDSSRCKVNGRELSDVVVLDREQLRTGVPILMGHGVVLLLREESRSTLRINRTRDDTALLGSSDYMNRLRGYISQIASSDLDVLIRGETGTGKELVATAIHSASIRGKAALVSVNMAAIPSSLAPAALFGSARGAYTGADKAGAGYFEQAEGGTLFLDEVGDTPTEIQAQLLRALQQREIQCVGGAIKQVDIRVISATDAPLEDETCDFKAALRHRLSGCEVFLLPLREHPEDIGELLCHFITQAALQAGKSELLPSETGDVKAIAFWAEVFHCFLMYSWPGNIRELANFAQQLVLAQGQGQVLPQPLQSAFWPEGGGKVMPERSACRKMQDIDDNEFVNSLEEARFELALAAKQMGVSRQAVYRRIDNTPDLRIASEVTLDELRVALAEHRGDLAATAWALRVSRVGLGTRLRNSTLTWH